MRNDLLGLYVSRETMQKLRDYEGMVRNWSKKINLVSPVDLDAIWNRHIIDSAQLVKFGSGAEKWVDLGSGGGFPGLVVAIIEDQMMRKSNVVLVESDKRKCAFLSTVARNLQIKVQIIPHRIENIPSQQATTLSARAVASLDRLLAYVDKHMKSDGEALLQKGRDWEKEVVAAKEKWSFDHDVVVSITDTSSVILRVRNLKRLSR